MNKKNEANIYNIHKNHPQSRELLEDFSFLSMKKESERELTLEEKEAVYSVMILNKIRVLQRVVRKYIYKGKVSKGKEYSLLYKDM